jgi:CubicO group peptidase (beta-lactamase class C family)
MATGIGDRTPSRLEDDGDNADERWWIGTFGNAASARDKLLIAFQAGNYEWGPGEVVRYNSLHTFVLAAAMDAYLKSVEGPEADLWARVTEEVLRPIGIPVAPMMHTREVGGGRGLPIMGWGLFLTVQDLAKIAQLYQDRGAHGGRQLLYANEIDAILEGERNYGRPVGRFNSFGQLSYGFSFWYVPYRDAQDCRVFVPEMRGFGDNLVALMPNGMSGIRLADEVQEPTRTWFGENIMDLADDLSPFCP